MAVLFCRTRRRSRALTFVILASCLIMTIYLSVMTSFFASLRTRVVGVNIKEEMRRSVVHTEGDASRSGDIRFKLDPSPLQLTSDHPLTNAVVNSTFQSTGVTKNNTSSSTGVANPCSIPRAQINTERRRNTDFSRVTVELPAVVRLGNQMFAHASLLGIARHNDLLPVISVRQNNKHLIKAFDLETPLLQHPENQKDCNADVLYADWLTFTETLPCTYDKRSEDVRQQMENSTKSNVLLSGYFQSWRYFDDFREDIVREFRFKISDRQVANSFLQKTRRKYCSTQVHLRDRCLTVGVHVRLGDMAGEDAKIQGYTTATAAYIVNAMTYMERRFNASRLIFVISSDNITWCQTAVRYVTLQPVVFFTQESDLNVAVAKWPDSVSLATVAACDHTIMTVGTFGWWAGYLAGGVTVYYKGFPLRGSRIAREFRAEDYFLPGWVGLT